jgi:hypothetical protein
VFAYDVSWFCHQPSSTQGSLLQSFLKLGDTTKRCVPHSVMDVGWSYTSLLLGYLETCSFYVALELQGIEVWSLD